MAYAEAGFVLCATCGTEVAIENAFEMPEWKYYCARCYAILQEQTALEMWPPIPDLEVTFEQPFYLLMVGNAPDSQQTRYANFPSDDAALEAMRRLAEIGQCHAYVFRLAPLGRVVEHE